MRRKDPCDTSATLLGADVVRSVIMSACVKETLHD